jgi:hypothetical protein
MTLAVANLLTLNASAEAGSAESYAFVISNAEVGNNQTVFAAVDNANGTLIFSNPQGNTNNYNLDVERTDALSQRAFNYDSITIDAGATHIIHYSLWGDTINGSAPVTIQVDQNSDGTVDSTIQLNSPINKVYLPMVAR